MQSSTIAHRVYFLHFSFKKLSQSGILSNSAYPLRLEDMTEDMQNRILLEVGVLSRRSQLANSLSPLHGNSLFVPNLIGFRDPKLSLQSSQKTYGYGQVPPYSITIREIRHQSSSGLESVPSPKPGIRMGEFC